MSVPETVIDLKTEYSKGAPAIPDEKKFRGWYFTDFVLDEEFVKKAFSKAQYITYGREVCPSTNKKHLQGFAYFKSPISISSMRKKFPNRTCLPISGTPAQNIKYCQKDKDFYESGEKPDGQGKRTDLDEIRDLLESQPEMPMQAVIDCAKSYQSVKMAEVILKYKEKPRNWLPEVYWFHGPSGTGKTKAAYEMLGPDCYTCMDNLKWFEGYDGHHNVLIDDIRRDCMSYKSLLKLLDRYAYRVETKGGSRQFLAKKIVITCPSDPTSLFAGNGEDPFQLTRRIKEIRYFGKTEEL